jgi:hypothetical protein
MTDNDRRAVADLAVVGLASVAAYVLFTNPQLRRTAFRLLKYVTLTAAPRLVWQETARAWAEAAALAPHPTPTGHSDLEAREQTRLKLP